MDTETSAGRIEETLLGGPRRYNRVQVSEATGVDRDRAQRLWTAMGFAEVGDDEAVFTDGDIEALRTWAALVASGTMAAEDEVPHARVMGQTLSRLAEKLTGTDASFVVDAETAGRLLAVTPRTARRLLHILVEEGLAWPLPPTRTPQPGRPRQFYRLVVEKLEPRRRNEPGQRAAQ